MADRRQLLRLTAVAAAAPTATMFPASPTTAAPAAERTSHPLVIGHRGACGYRPEHTLASYELAARLGADYLETDLVTTSDGVLVCRHEPEISGTTDVAKRREFASRRRTHTVDGKRITGWFTHDFTLAELKTLRAVERMPGLRQSNTLYGGLFQIPTFQQVLDLRAQLSEELGRELGIFPETKHPTYFRRLGLGLEAPLVQALRRNDLDRPDAKVIIESFEAGNLHALRQHHRVRVQLLFLTATGGTPFNDNRSYADYLTPQGLRDLARDVHLIGPNKDQVIRRRHDGRLGKPTGLVADAHAAGLQVIPYTFRAENKFLPTDYRVGNEPNAYGRAIDEQIAFLRAGVDGLITDQTDIGVLARHLTRQSR